MGVIRTQTQQMPMTAKPFSSQVIKRQTTTTDMPVQENSNNPVIDITGYTTLRGKARQGVTPNSGRRNANASASGSSQPRKVTTRGLFR